MSNSTKLTCALYM